MANPVSFERLASRAAFETEPPEHLYHYTDLEGVEGILSSKSLWMSKFTASNDISEITLAISQFQNFVESRVAALGADEASFLHEAASQLDGFRRTNICLASFCEQPDLLSQWRSYGNDGRGIALGFDTGVLLDLAQRYSLKLWRCVYDRATHVKVSNDLLTMLLESFRAVKPKGAEERREIVAQCACHRFFERILGPGRRGRRLVSLGHRGNCALRLWKPCRRVSTEFTPHGSWE